MTEISKPAKTFYQLCDDLAAKRAAGTMPKEQIEAMDAYKKDLITRYNRTGVEDIKLKSGTNPHGDYFEKSTATE